MRILAWYEQLQLVVFIFFTLIKQPSRAAKRFDDCSRVLHPHLIDVLRVLALVRLASSWYHRLVFCDSSTGSENRRCMGMELNVKNTI
jgi:hypothetical protein